MKTTWWMTDPDILALSSDEARNPADGMLFNVSFERKLRLLRKTKSLVNSVKKYFKQGYSALDWYDNTFTEIHSLLGNTDNAVFFIRLLAATSPRCGIVDNVNRALSIYSAARRRKKFHVSFGSHALNVERVMRGEPLRGPKVQAFEKNILPIEHGGDPTVVTVDIWMMRAFKRPSSAPNRTEYRGITKIVRELAAEENVEPRQYQAAVWVGIKALEGNPKDTSAPFEEVLSAKLHASRTSEQLSLFDNEEDIDETTSIERHESVPDFDIYKALDSGPGPDPLYDPELEKAADEMRDDVYGRDA